MARKNTLADVDGRSKGQEVPAIFCKLFTDMVTEHLCFIRRRELNSRGGFSCEGCSLEQSRVDECAYHDGSLRA